MRLTGIFLLFLIVSTPLAVVGQNVHKISGVVIDGETDAPLEFATVSLMSLPDSVLVVGGITGSDGRFALPVEFGNYLLRIQFVTYGDHEQQVAMQGKDVNVGSITLDMQSSELEEVVVQAERTQMEMTLDKKVFNVGQDLSNLGGSASDILSNLPSVTVDIDGNVQLRGSSSVKVLIDGKPSGLVGLSSTDALKQLQGDMVESVEIITNPSARYDAEGMAGIINIILKKDKKKGVNGSFQLNTGYPHNHGASVNMNFRREWINFFVNYGMGYRNNPGGGNVNQEYHLDEAASTTGVADYYTALRRKHHRSGLNNNIRFGADLFVGEKSSLTLAFLYRYSDQLNKTKLRYFDQSIEDRSPLYYTQRDDEENEGDNNLEYSVNYTKTFKRKDHKLTADIQYQNNNELEKSDILQQSGTNPNDITNYLQQKVRNDEGEERLMLQADYIRPFGLKSKLEAGFRSTIRRVTNIYNVNQLDEETQEYYELDEYSTDFSYNENVHAAYAIVSDERDMISWQAGLRSEYTDINSNQREEADAQRKWNYFNFFPSLFFTYKLGAVSQLQLSYSRRITRPRFRELNPFSSFTDNRNFRVGNPKLQPEFTDSYEFGLLQNKEKATFYYGVYYRHSTDLIRRVTLSPNAAGERYSVPYNIGQKDDVGLEGNVTYEFASWYRVSGNANFYRGEISGSVGDSVSLDATTVTFNGRVSNNFKINDLTDVQLNYFYRAPQNEAQGRTFSMQSLDLGVARDVFNKNGTLSVSVNDILNTRKFRFENETEGYYEKGEWQWRRGPVVQASFTYRLNQKKARDPQGSGEFDGDGGF